MEGLAHRPPTPTSSFLGLPFRILNINHKKELLRSLWVEAGENGLGALCELWGSELQTARSRGAVEASTGSPGWGSA